MRERRRGEQKRSLRHFFSLSHRPTPSVRVKGPESLGSRAPQALHLFVNQIKGGFGSAERLGGDRSLPTVAADPPADGSCCQVLGSGQGPAAWGQAPPNPNYWRHSDLVSGHALAHGGDGSGGSRDLLASVLASRSPRQHSARSDRLRQLPGRRHEPRGFRQELRSPDRSVGIGTERGRRTASRRWPHNVFETVGVDWTRERIRRASILASTHDSPAVAWKRHNPIGGRVWQRVCALIVRRSGPLHNALADVATQARHHPIDVADRLLQPPP